MGVNCDMKRMKGVKCDMKNGWRVKCDVKNRDGELWYEKWMDGEMWYKKKMKVWNVIWKWKMTCDVKMKNDLWCKKYIMSCDMKNV